MTGSEIKTIRITLGYSQRQLGDELGVHEQTVSRWERADSVPRLVELAIKVLESCFAEKADQPG